MYALDKQVFKYEVDAFLGKIYYNVTCIFVTLTCDRLIA